MNYLSKGGDKYDLLKVTLSILIVLLHTRPLPNFFFPILRTAVPLFFIISSFFFFNKIQNTNWEFTILSLKRFITRNLYLYLFWFVVLFPVTLYRHSWFEFGFLMGIIRMIRSFLFGSTFAASWFIMALVIAVSIVTYASKYVGNWLLVFCSLIAYIFCSSDANYHYLVENIPYIKSVFSLIHNSIGVPYLSFPVALIWVVIAKLIAEHQFSLSLSKGLPLLIAALVCLYVERNIIIGRSWVLDDDCYLSLLFFCPLFFIIVSQCEMYLPYASTFRKFSTILYCSHLSILTIIEYALNQLWSLSINRLCLFIMCFLVSLILSILLLSLEKKIPILKYAH